MLQSSLPVASTRRSPPSAAAAAWPAGPVRVALRPAGPGGPASPRAALRAGGALQRRPCPARRRGRAGRRGPARRSGPVVPPRPAGRPGRRTLTALARGQQQQSPDTAIIDVSARMLFPPPRLMIRSLRPASVTRSMRHGWHRFVVPSDVRQRLRPALAGRWDGSLRHPRGACRCCTAVPACVSRTRDFRGVRTLLRPRPEIRSPTLISRACAARSARAPSLRNCPDEHTHVAGDEPIVSGMAGRYATALFELALEEHAIDAVKADLDRFDALIAESADLQRLVRSPVFTAEEQTKALVGGARQGRHRRARGAVPQGGGIEPPAVRGARHDPRLPRRWSRSHKGEVTGEVTVAEKPSDAHLAAIKDALKAVTRQGRAGRASRSIRRSSAG